MLETSNSQVDGSLVSTLSNDGFGLIANVRKIGDVFEIILIEALSGVEVLTTSRTTREEAEKFAAGLMRPSLDLRAALPRRLQRRTYPGPSAPSWPARFSCTHLQPSH